MPLPPGMDTGTVSFDFERADGDPAILGTVHLIPTGYRQELSVIVVPEALTIAVTGGPQTKVVAATTNDWKYAVTEDLATRKRRRYVIDVPAGGTVDLSVAAHLEIPLSFVTVVQTVNGVRPDAAGNVDVAGGGGGGGVASVTALDATVTVGGTVTNPKVGVNAIPESKVTNLVADLAAKAPSTRSVASGTGLTGGGDLSADRTLTVTYGSIGGTATQGNDPRNSDARTPLAHVHVEADVTNLTADLAGKAPTSRLVTAGTGLTGGGSLAADRTLTVAYGTTAGTTTEGNDSRITGAIQATLVNAKGDLIAATADDAVTRLGIGSGGQVLTADSTQSTGLRYADPAYETFPLSADGLVAASAPLSAFRDHSTLGTAAWLTLLRIPAGKTATKAWTAINTAGTLGAGGENSFGVYDLAGTFLQQTVTNDNQWTSTGVTGALLASPIVAPSSADLYVYVGLRVTGYVVGPDFAFLQGSANAGLMDGAFGVGRKRSLILGGSSWAGSINPNGTGGSGFMPFIALS